MSILETDISSSNANSRCYLNVIKERETIRTYAAARSRVLTGWGSSLATRFAFGTVLLIAAVTTLFVSELTRLEWQRLSESKRSAATMMAELLAGSLEAALDFGDQEAIKERVGTLRSSVEILNAAVFAKGQVEPLAQYQRSEGQGCSASRMKACQIRAGCEPPVTRPTPLMLRSSFCCT